MRKTRRRRIRCSRRRQSAPSQAAPDLVMQLMHKSRLNHISGQMYWSRRPNSFQKPIFLAHSSLMRPTKAHFLAKVSVAATDSARTGARVCDAQQYSCAWRFPIFRRVLSYNVAAGHRPALRPSGSHRPLALVMQLMHSERLNHTSDGLYSPRNPNSFKKRIFSAHFAVIRGRKAHFWAKVSGTEPDFVQKTHFLL